MRNYTVTMDVTYTGRIDVEAASEVEAEQIAREHAKRSDLDDIDFLDATATQILFNPLTKARSQS
jgi:anti-anti-sigma regulatory factor